MLGDTSPLGIVADIGGTNCRFALVSWGKTQVSAPVSFPVADFPDIQKAIHAYLQREAPKRKVSWAVIAVAGPVDRDVVTMTNHSWRIAGPEIAAEFGMKEVRLVNDFTALARSTPLLEPAHLVAVGGGVARAAAGVTTTAVVGAGTGLGVGGLVIGGGVVLPLTTEGGHATFSPTDELEREINRVLLTRFERVSNERILCGDGLVNLHWALAQIEGAPPEVLRPRDVTARAKDGSDKRSVLAVEVFSRVMGSFAGDVALMMGARGGVYVAGGLAPAMIGIFDNDAFRARFEAKGRFRRYMEETPTWIVTHPFAALAGAAALAETTLTSFGRKSADAVAS